MGRVKTDLKQQLVAALAKAAGIEEAQADFFYEVFINEMLKRLKKQEEVILVSIGKIGFVREPAAKSNLTGQHVPPHKRLKFFPNECLAKKIRVITREYPI